MKAIKEIWNFTIVVQLIIFVFFILMNINNLSQLQYVYSFNDVSYTITINFYYYTGILVGVYLVVLLLSLNIVGSGVNDYGSFSIGRLLGLLLLYLILTNPIYYYASVLPFYGSFWILIISIPYVLHGIDLLIDGKSEG